VSLLTNHYKGANVLVNGHTGFKGSWLCQWLIHLGAKVSGISINVRRELISQNVSSYALDCLDRISKLYEERFLGEFE